MKASRLVELIKDAIERHGDLEVMYMDEVWLKIPNSYSIETENEYGVEETDIPKHIRLFQASEGGIKR